MKFKRNFAKLILLLLIVSLSCKNEKKKPIKINNIETVAHSPKEMILEFYKKYITDLESGNSKKSIDFKMYLTDELISEIKEKDLDFDYIVKAQDSNIEWLKTLKVENTKKDNVYCISYEKGFYDSDDNKIFVTVLKEKGQFKISKIKRIIDDASNDLDVFKRVIGTWKVDCSNSSSNIIIKNQNDILITLNSNGLKIKVKTNVENEFTLNVFLDQLVDIRENAIKLNCNNFSKKTIIGTLYINPNNNLVFNWLGFYDTGLNERVWVEGTDFQKDYDNKYKNDADYEESENYFILEKCN